MFYFNVARNVCVVFLCGPHAHVAHSVRCCSCYCCKRSSRQATRAVWWCGGGCFGARQQGNARVAYVCIEITRRVRRYEPNVFVMGLAKQ